MLSRELVKVACQAILQPLRQLQEAFLWISQTNARQRNAVNAPSNSPFLLTRISGGSQEESIDWDIVNGFIRSLKSVSVLRHKIAAPGSQLAELREFCDSHLPDMSFEILAALSRVPPSLGRSAWRTSSRVRQLFVLSIPPSCCSRHIFGRATYELCIVSKERSPQESPLLKSSPVEDSISQTFLFVAGPVLKEYGEDPNHCPDNTLYAAIVLFSHPLISLVAMAQSELHQHAVEGIRLAIRNAPRTTFETARATTCIIHALLNPKREDPLSSKDFTAGLGLPDAEVYVGICAILRKACSEPFYKCSEHFLGPDEMSTDILLWLGGLSFDESQQLHLYMPLWLHIVKRSLIPHVSSSSGSRKGWQQPSDHLRRNICRLMACDALFGRGDAAKGDGASSAVTRRRDPDTGEESAEFWRSSDVQCAAVAIADLQLERWYWENHADDEDLTPLEVLKSTVQALAQLQVANIHEIKGHLDNLRGRIRFFQEHPTDLFAGHRRDDLATQEQAVGCAPLLELLGAMLAPVPDEGAPQWDEDNTSISR